MAMLFMALNLIMILMLLMLLLLSSEFLYGKIMLGLFNRDFVQINFNKGLLSL